jgi:hypothetical protein
MEDFMSAETKSRSAWGAGRIAFAALSPEIFGELAREIPMSVVYRKYKDRLGISYSQFTRHVRAFKARQNFNSLAATAVRGLPAHRGGACKPAAKPHPPRLAEAERSMGFHFDPADIDSKKLI